MHNNSGPEHFLAIKSDYRVWPGPAVHNSVQCKGNTQGAFLPGLVAPPTLPTGTPQVLYPATPPAALPSP